MQEKNESDLLALTLVSSLGVTFMQEYVEAALLRGICAFGSAAEELLKRSDLEPSARAKLENLVKLHDLCHDIFDQSSATDEVVAQVSKEDKYHVN